MTKCSLAFAMIMYNSIGRRVRSILLPGEHGSDLKGFLENDGRVPGAPGNPSF